VGLVNDIQLSLTLDPRFMRPDDGTEDALGWREQIDQIEHERTSDPLLEELNFGLTQCGWS
jgi:hypothetical protein